MFAHSPPCLTICLIYREVYHFAPRQRRQSTLQTNTTCSRMRLTPYSARSTSGTRAVLANVSSGRLFLATSFSGGEDIFSVVCGRVQIKRVKFVKMLCSRSSVWTGSDVNLRKRAAAAKTRSISVTPVRRATPRSRRHCSSDCVNLFYYSCSEIRKCFLEELGDLIGDIYNSFHREEFRVLLRERSHIHFWTG